MKVRGAPLIGVTGAFGVYMACLEARQERNGLKYISERAEKLHSARPTAINLPRAVDRIMEKISEATYPGEKIRLAREESLKLMEEEKESSFRIGTYGLELIREASLRNTGNPVNILTHCNAGWLAFVDYGSATAPIYAARDRDINLHVWVDETRPWNQGSRLTCWELQQEGIAHTLITDNAGGHLMQHGQVDLVIVGSDRTTRTGDVANKIGTYLKALAARDNNVPFYVALPSSTLDWNLTNGADIEIEIRSGEEITTITGLTKNGTMESVRLTAEGIRAANYGFDVTPARLVTGLITERGITAAEESAITDLFADKSGEESS
jgi:methylthioribose-1-phosphate isomerase